MYYSSSYYQGSCSKYDLIGPLLQVDTETEGTPIVVHCMDGASQSGLYVACSVLIEKIREESVADVFHTIKHMKRRRPHFINTLVINISQYHTLISESEWIWLELLVYHVKYKMVWCIGNKPQNEDMSRFAHGSRWKIYLFLALYFRSSTSFASSYSGIIFTRGWISQTMEKTVSILDSVLITSTRPSWIKRKIINNWRKKNL